MVVPAAPPLRIVATLRLLALLATLLVTPCANASSATLWIDAAKTHGEWGRVLTVRVYLNDPRRNLQDLDLSSWRQQLHVTRDEVQWRDPPQEGADSSNQLQVMRLLLHPLRPGPVTLPPLEVSGAYSKPLRLEIASSQQDGSPLQPTLTLNTRQPWERQQTVVTVSVDSPAAHAVLQAEAALHIPGFEVHPIPLQRTPQGDHTRLTLGWALFPLVAGDYPLRLPAIEYRVNGRKAYSWHLPDTPVAVKALPGYLPPTLPVGQLQVHSELQPAGVLDPQQLAWWNITISGPLPVAWLPSARPPPPANAQTHILAAEQTLSSTINSSGIDATRRQQFPIRPGSSGYLQLPGVAISWFDPQLGQLQRYTISAPPRWVIARHWRLLAGILATLVGLFMLCKGIAWARHSLHQHRDHRLALAKLAAADSPHQLRQALNQLASVHGARNNLSLRAWLAHWHQHYQLPAGLEDCLNRLSRHCYRPDGDTPATLDPALKQQLLHLVKRPRRL